MKPYEELTRLGLLRRLKKLGCTRVFANGCDPPADALYGSVLGTKEVSKSWCREL